MIDFSDVGIDDPACDMVIAWSLLKPHSRRIFRENLETINDDTWERGRGWALSIELIMLPNYKNTNPTLAMFARRMIENLLCDSGMNNSPIIRFANTSDAEQVAMCHVASWKKIYRGHIPDAVLDTLSVKKREKKWRDLLAKNVKLLVIMSDDIIT